MKALGLLLIILGVLANNVVYLQDLWLGQESITLDGWRAYGGLLVSIAVIIVGMVLLARSRPASDPAGWHSARRSRTRRAAGDQACDWSYSAGFAMLWCACSSGWRRADRAGRRTHGIAAAAPAAQE